MTPPASLDVARAAAWPVFVGLAPAAIDEILSAGRVLDYQTGQVVFRQNDPGSEVFVLEAGHLEVSVRTESGEQVLALLSPGSLVGEVALFAPGPRSATVRAIGPVRLWGLERATYDRLRDQGSTGAVHLAHRMAETLASRLRSTNQLMQDAVLAEDDAFASGYYQPVPLGELSQSSGLPIRVASDLRHKDLVDLIDGRILAIRVPDYYNRRLCDQLCRRLLRHPGFARYLIAPDVGVQRIGMTLFETQQQAELLDRYYHEARPTMVGVRRLCQPLLTPIDRLRLELEELWPSGARIEQLHGRKMLVGTARMFEDSHHLHPHQDVLHRDLPGVPAALEITRQLTANVYLRLAMSGGEIELWDARPDDAEAARLYTGQHDFFDRAKLPPPAARMRPTQGELIVWLSDRVHAVLASQGGPRVSMSCFMGFRSHEVPLTLWS